MPADYKPARLWTQAIAPFECCPGDQPFPFYSVKAGGQTLHDGMVDGGATGRSDGSTQFEPGTPVVLDAGEYEMTAWLSALSPSGPTGSPTEPCVAGVVLRGDHDGYMQVTFAKDGSCMWDVAPLPTPSP
jgi:hypothetical protein